MEKSWTKLYFSFGGTKSNESMLLMSSGLNPTPTEWEINFTDILGEQLSAFVKTGLPARDIERFSTSGAYTKVILGSKSPGCIIYAA